MGKSKLEFYAKITTSDGREITKRVEEEGFPYRAIRALAGDNL